MTNSQALGPSYSTGTHSEHEYYITSGSLCSQARCSQLPLEKCPCPFHCLINDNGKDYYFWSFWWWLWWTLVPKETVLHKPPLLWDFSASNYPFAGATRKWEPEVSSLHLLPWLTLSSRLVSMFHARRGLAAKKEAWVSFCAVDMSGFHAENNLWFLALAGSALLSQVTVTWAATGTPGSSCLSAGPSSSSRMFFSSSGVFQPCPSYWSWLSLTCREGLQMANLTWPPHREVSCSSCPNPNYIPPFIHMYH